MIQGMPDCCNNCQHFDWDWSEYSGKTYVYCALNIWFPTKKNTCKKQKPYKKETHYRCDICKRSVYSIDNLVGDACDSCEDGSFVFVDEED